MLPLPEQRRPPLTRRHERFPCTAQLAAGIAVRGSVGWQVVQAVRRLDGTIEAVFER